MSFISIPPILLSSIVMVNMFSVQDAQWEVTPVGLLILGFCHIISIVLINSLDILCLCVFSR